MFKKVADKEYITIYYDSIRLSNGQCACIFFYKGKNEGNYEIYEVGFAIGRTRKQIFNTFIYESDFLKNKETGRCGLEGLVWAKSKLLEFEGWIKNKTTHPVKIYVGWADERRKKAYMWG